MAKETNAGATAPATLEDAQAQVTELTTKLTAAEQALEAEKKAKADAIKALEVEKKNTADALKQVEDLKTELKDAADVIEELKAKAETGGKSKGPIVVIGKQKYLVKAGTVINGKPFAKEDIAANKELCKELIDKGSTLLKEVK